MELKFLQYRTDRKYATIYRKRDTGRSAFRIWPEFIKIFKEREAVRMIRPILPARLSCWTLTDEIGHGSYGWVYGAKRQVGELEDFAAIKYVHVNTEENFQRMIKEIAIMCQVQGDANIVTIKDYDAEKCLDSVGWDVYIVMERLRKFSDYRDDFSDEKLPEEEVIRLGSEICHALEICEAEGIIHRDIKEDNILVGKRDQFKLTDFGISRIHMEEEETGTCCGTRDYMAPEIDREERYGSNVDLYSLGIVLYRLMNNNRQPFESAYGLPNVIERGNYKTRRLKGEPLPPPAFASPRFSEIILKACQFQPQNRYQSASEMKRDLDQLLAGDVLPDFGITPSQEAQKDRMAEKTPEEENATIIEKRKCMFPDRYKYLLSVIGIGGICLGIGYGITKFDPKPDSMPAAGVQEEVQAIPDERTEEEEAENLTDKKIVIDPDLLKNSKNTISLAMSGEPKSFLPGRKSDKNSVFMADQLFEGLLTYGSSDPLTVETTDLLTEYPNLLNQNAETLPEGFLEIEGLSYGMADSVDISSDGLVYTFHIREEACWSDGVPVKAEDFVYAWNVLILDSTMSDYFTYFEDILKNSYAIIEKQNQDLTLGVKALDSQTLEVVLEKRCPYFLSMCASSVLAPLREDLKEQKSGGQLVTNGPYSYLDLSEQIKPDGNETEKENGEETDKNDRPTDQYLRKNDYYWDKAFSGAEVISLYYDADPMNESYDCVYDPNKEIKLPGNTMELQKTLLTADETVLFLNQERIGNWKVRGAILLMSHSGYLEKTYGKNRQMERESMITTETNEAYSIYHWLEQQYPEYDLDTNQGKTELALRLVREAEEEGADLSIEYVIGYKEDGIHAEVAEALATALDGIGISAVTLGAANHTVFLASITKSCDMILYDWSSGHREDMEKLQLVSCDSTCNYAEFEDPGYESILDAYKELVRKESEKEWNEADLDKISSIKQEASDYLFSDLGFVLIPLYQNCGRICFEEPIGKVPASPEGSILLKSAKLYKRILRDKDIHENFLENPGKYQAGYDGDVIIWMPRSWIVEDQPSKEDLEEGFDYYCHDEKMKNFLLIGKEKEALSIQQLYEEKQKEFDTVSMWLLNDHPSVVIEEDSFTQIYFEKNDQFYTVMIMIDQKENENTYYNVLTSIACSE